MGGVIELSKDEDSGHLWAGWVFRQILEDTLVQCSGDAEIAEAFETAGGIGALLVYNYSPEVAGRIIKSMRAAIESILTGQVQSKLEEKPYAAFSREQYEEVLRSVLKQLLSARSNTAQ